MWLRWSALLPASLSRPGPLETTLPWKEEPTGLWGSNRTSSQLGPSSPLWKVSCRDMEFVKIEIIFVQLPSNLALKRHLMFSPQRVPVTSWPPIRGRCCWLLPRSSMKRRPPLLGRKNCWNQVVGRLHKRGIKATIYISSPPKLCFWARENGERVKNYY